MLVNAKLKKTMQESGMEILGRKAQKFGWDVQGRFHTGSEFWIKI